MSFAPFDPGLAIALLQQSVPTLRQVKGAADYAAIKTLRDFVSPSAYVVLAKESAKVDSGITGPHQHVVASFGVVVAVRNYQASGLGMQGKEDLLHILDGIRGALLAWTPKLPGARPVRLLQGDTLDYDQATLLWLDTYQVQYSLRPNAQ